MKNSTFNAALSPRATLIDFLVLFPGHSPPSFPVGAPVSKGEHAHLTNRCRRAAQNPPGHASVSARSCDAPNHSATAEPDRSGSVSVYATSSFQAFYAKPLLTFLSDHTISHVTTLYIPYPRERHRCDCKQSLLLAKWQAEHRHPVQ